MPIIRIRTVSVNTETEEIEIPDGLTREWAVEVAKIRENRYRRDRFKTAVDIIGLSPEEDATMGSRTMESESRAQLTQQIAGAALSLVGGGGSGAEGGEK